MRWWPSNLRLLLLRLNNRQSSIRSNLALRFYNRGSRWRLRKKNRIYYRLRCGDWRRMGFAWLTDIGRMINSLRNIIKKRKIRFISRKLPILLILRTKMSGLNLASSWKKLFRNISKLFWIKKEWKRCRAFFELVFIFYAFTFFKEKVYKSQTSGFRSNKIWGSGEYMA